MSSATSSIGGRSHVFLESTVQVPGVSNSDSTNIPEPMARPTGGVAARQRKARNSIMTQDNVNFKVVCRPKDPKRIAMGYSLGIGQMVWGRRVYDPHYHGAVDACNLQELNYEMANDSKAYDTQESVLEKWNFLGIIIAITTKNANYEEGQTITVTAWGVSPQLSSIWGSNIQPLTKCNLILKKINLSMREEFAYMPNGRIEKQRRLGEPSVFQWVPYAHPEHGYPPLSARKYMDGGVEHYGPVWEIAEIQSPDSVTTPEIADQASRNAMIHVPMLPAIITNHLRGG